MPQKRKIITYQEVKKILPGENKEPLINVCYYDSDIIAKHKKNDMIPYTGKRIFVRDTVAKKLATINKRLKKHYKLRIKVVYGYRHPNIQKKYFREKRDELQNLNPSLSNEELDTLTHNFVAVPLVAGHPTGGAIDVTLTNKKGKNLDMGTKLFELKNKKIKTFAKGLSKKQQENRILLHDVLTKENFAPFYGEWWHFSYGDREWACFYERKKSLYSQIKYKIEKK